MQVNKLSTNAVHQITESFTQSLLKGELKPGDKVPTEIELSEKFGVSRNTTREAIKILVAMGVLEIRRPEGTFVRTGFSESLVDPMVYGIILNKGDSYDNLMELREMMEVGIMHLVIEKASDEEIESLREPLKVLEEACRAEKPDLEAVFEADNAFHEALNELGGNPIVTKLSQIVRMLTHAMRHESVETMIAAGKTEELYLAHEKILCILRSRDDSDMNHKIRTTYFVNGKAVE